MEQFFEHYELPPGPDRQRYESEKRLQPYSNSGFNVTSSDEGGGYDHKRRSWQDMMDQQSHTYPSDNSSFNSSYSTVITQKPIETINNAKRRSWDKLVESDENLKKHDQLIVSILPEPLKPISLMMVKDGRLGKVNLYNKKLRKIKNPSTSSKTSTISEFILVPRPDSSDSFDETINDQNIHDSSKNNSFHKMDDKDKVLCHWSARRTTFAIIATFGLCIFVGLIGYFIRRILESQNNEFMLNFINAKDSSAFNLNVFFAKSSAILFLNSSSSLKRSQSLIDFKNKLIIHQNISNSDYCFVQNLNETILPNKEAVKAAITILSKVPQNVDLLQDWNWQVISAKDSMSYNEAVKDICGNSNKIFSLQKSSLSQQNVQCYQCLLICFPNYGIVKISDRDWIFTILNEICFYFSTSDITQTTLIPTQNSFSNRQDWQPQQFQFRQPLFNINQVNSMSSLTNPNGAFTFNGQSFGR